MKKKVLVVDDEINIVELLTMNLEKNGFEVISCLTGEESLKLCSSEVPDIIILDLMLPGIDGLEVCKRIRSQKETARIPIIMLTAKAQESDMIIGLELGADDYITKPFSVRELITRIKVVLRRIDEKIEEDTSIIRIHDIEVDTEKHIITKNGQKIDLTLKEFKIFRSLAENYEKVLSREYLLKEISSEDIMSELRSIDVHITNIRKKFKNMDSGWDFIETIRGIGYKMN